MNSFVKTSMVRRGWGATGIGGRELTRGCYALKHKYHLPAVAHCCAPPVVNPFRYADNIMELCHEHTLLATIQNFFSKLFSLQLQIEGAPPEMVDKACTTHVRCDGEKTHPLPLGEAHGFTNEVHFDSLTQKLVNLTCHACA